MYRGRYDPGDEIGRASPPSRTRYSTPPAHVNRSANMPAKGRRIACVLVADFAVAAIARANPELRGRPFALTRTPAKRSAVREYQPHSELSHVSAEARAAGVRSGMTAAQARALVPDLRIIAPSPAAERAAADALLDVAESISPVVEEGAPGCVWLDLTGSERLSQSAAGADFSAGEPAADMDGAENSLTAELLRRARRIGLEASAAIASSKEIAHLAARCGGARVVADGREREFLDWMPLDLAGLDERGGDMEQTFKRLGIRRLGDLARFDINAIGSRFGRRGAELARLARGEGSATVIARARVETFVEEAEFEYGVENLEPLGFVLRAMASQLAGRLEMRGLAGGDMSLSLGLADRRRDERRIAVAAATVEARTLLALLKLSLEKLPPPAPVESIRLAIEPRNPRAAQTDMFLPAAPAPDRLEAAVARIAALSGPDRVGTIAPADSHRPEAARLGAFAPPPPSPHDVRTAGANVTPIAICAIRPAEEVEVLCAREMPEFIRGGRVCARVISIAGPWRRQGEWWAADVAPAASPTTAPGAFARDYYELALADGAVYRAYRDLDSGKWFIDGIYD